MVERHEGGVVDRRVGAPAIHRPVDPDRITEQQEGLVHEVRAQVTMRSASLGGVLAPGFGQRHLDLETRLQAVDPAEGAGLDQLPDGQEVTVEPAVVIHGQDPASPCGCVDQSARIGCIGRDRLVSHDVAARLQCPDAEGHVGGIRGGHDHDLDIRSVEQRGHRIDDGRFRMFLPRGGLPVGARCRDRGDVQPVHRRDERRMEVATGEAVADDPDADRVSRRHRIAQ